MFGLQRRFYEETCACTRDRFYEVVRSQEVTDTVDRCRQLVAAGDTKAYDAEKKKLPGFIFMSTMMPNKGKNGQNPEGAWRLQSAARLNGLIMHDFDKLSGQGLTPQEVFTAIPRHWFADDARFSIRLAHVTVGGDGLRLVSTADPRLNIEDNQQALATALAAALGKPLKADKSVINSDRTSFAVKESDILYINENIFNYENPEYDRAYGDLYRHGHHRKKTPPPSPPLEGRGVSAGQGNPTPPSQGGAGGGSLPSQGGAGGGSSYRGVALQAIVDEWLRQKGAPQPGERHVTMLRLAGDLRYICDNDPGRLREAVRLAPFVRDIERERGSEEIDNACDDACERKMYMSIPRAFREVLAAVKAEGYADRKEEGADYSVYDTFWKRLQPLMAAPYTACCDGQDDRNKLGIVFVAGTMYCTLLTRCWYRHFDGDIARMNPQAYLIGMPASGKSVADKLDEQIMAPMRSADRRGREAEAEYKRQQKERSTSSKAQKGEALKRPEIMIRYLPSKTSNAVFYRRLKNAHEEVDGEEMNLHLYTFDSELDSNTVAQSSGSWIGKHDIELKAFHNESTGVDFANSDSVNDILPVYFNQVETGTPLSLSRKINMRNVNDGLCSRLAIFPMISDSYKMVAKGNPRRNHEKYCEQRLWAYEFDTLKGELKIDRLVDHVYGLCEQSAWEAEASSDMVLDYLRKRAVFYATWFTVPRIVARAVEARKKSEAKVDDALELVTVEDSDLQFATLVYDAIIYWQDHFFGKMLEDSWQNAANETQPRKKRRSKYDEILDMLPEVFTTDDLMAAAGCARNAAQTQATRWLKRAAITRVGNDRSETFQKTCGGKDSCNG